MAASLPSSPASKTIITSDDVHELASKLIEMGYSPAVVRKRLAEQGLRWQYNFNPHSSLRSRLRRLHAQGRGLCTSCHAGSYLLDGPVDICPECLDKKFSV